jgi:hypothetical protein
MFEDSRAYEHAERSWSVLRNNIVAGQDVKSWHKQKPTWVMCQMLRNSKMHLFLSILVLIKCNRPHSVGILEKNSMKKTTFKLVK